MGVGMLVSGAGVVALTAAVSGGANGWLEPIRPSYALPVVAALLGSALVLGCAGLRERWRASRAGRGTTAWRRRTIPAVGLVSAGAGVALLLASWLFLHRSSPAGELILTEGETAEAFQGRVAGEPVSVRLPQRMTLQRAEYGSVRSFEVALSKPDADPHRRDRLLPGQTMEFGGVRVAPVGLTADTDALRATIGSTESETISTTVGSGDSFRLRPDGPQYEVLQIVENYLGSTGPAVQMKSEPHGEFWAFRPVAGSTAPEFIHDLRVEGIERAPGVVFSVAPAVPRWPAGLGGALLLIGFAAIVAAPERIRIGGGDGGGRLASFNDAGRLLADLADEEET